MAAFTCFVKFNCSSAGKHCVLLYASAISGKELGIEFWDFRDLNPILEARNVRFSSFFPTKLSIPLSNFERVSYKSSKILTLLISTAAFQPKQTPKNTLS